MFLYRCGAKHRAPPIQRKEEHMRRLIDEVPRAGPLSRRRFFGLATGAAGGVMGSGLWTPAQGEHDREREDEHKPRVPGPCPEADPIPHINSVPVAFGAAAHFFFPGPVDGSATPTDPEGAHPAGRDPSTIFNFDGFVGVADLNLTGTGTDTTTGATARYDFHTDMRFATGRFVGTDRRLHEGTFVFI
jgi:hypothetical protein